MSSLCVVAMGSDAGQPRHGTGIVPSCSRVAGVERDTGGMSCCASMCHRWPALGGTGVSARSPGQAKPRAGAVGDAADEAAPSPVQSRVTSGPSTYSAAAQVFDQINFYYYQSDWSVESKRAFPSH